MAPIAGHGVSDADGTCYFVSVNFDVERKSRTGLLSSDIKRCLSTLSGKTLFFFDSCHSGAALGTGGAKGLDINGVVSDLVSAENGAIIFASCTGRQRSYEDTPWGNGRWRKYEAYCLDGDCGFIRIVWVER